MYPRFSQFQQLYKQLSTVHKQLYLHGKFPDNIPTSYFNRKNPEVIEQRRDWSLQLLEFIASQPILNTHPVFTNFLFDTAQEHSLTDITPLGGDPGAEDKDLLGLSVGGEIRKSSPELSDLEVVISPNISIDHTPVLSPVTVMEKHDDTDEKHDDTEDVTDAESKQNLENIVSQLSGKTRDNLVSSSSLISLETSLEEGESSSNIVPEYIKSAAEHVSSALKFEAEDDIEQSLSSYRAAIGGLLTHVQTDPDSARQAQVKRRIAQYISKAEQLGKVF